MSKRKVLFGVALGEWSGADLAQTSELVQTAVQADREGLDIFSLADHPYRVDRVDAYAALGFVLGATTRIRGSVGVTNLPSRPAPVLAHTITSLSALSGGRVVLGIGSGGIWDSIVKLGVPRLTPGEAVTAMEEAITLVRALSGGGGPVSFEGRHYRVTDLDPSPVPTPPIMDRLGWTQIACSNRTAGRRLDPEWGCRLAQPALPGLAPHRRQGSGGLPDGIPRRSPPSSTSVAGSRRRLNRPPAAAMDAGWEGR